MSSSVRSRKNKSKVLKPSLIKDCSVKLQRLSTETLRRYLNDNEKDITHNIHVNIRDNEMKIGNKILTSINSTFFVKLKVSSDQVIVVDSSKSIPNRIVTRNLRKRVNALDSISDASPKLTVAPCRSKPIYKLADLAWRKCKSNHKQNGHKISVNDVIMTKVRSYSPWPAIVLEFVNKKRIKVEFFGVDQNEKFGFIDLVEITRFSDSAEVIFLLLKRNICKFKKAVLEAELFCGIPNSVSLCKV